MVGLQCVIVVFPDDMHFLWDISDLPFAQRTKQWLSISSKSVLMNASITPA